MLANQTINAYYKRQDIIHLSLCSLEVSTMIDCL